MKRTFHLYFPLGAMLTRGDVAARLRRFADEYEKGGASGAATLAHNDSAPRGELGDVGWTTAFAMRGRSLSAESATAPNLCHIPTGALLYTPGIALSRFDTTGVPIIHRKAPKSGRKP